MKSKLASTFLVTVLAFAGCSNPQTGGAGGSSSGGRTSSGGNVGTGGKPSEAGSTGSGGATSAGGSSSGPATGGAGGSAGGGGKQGGAGTGAGGDHVTGGSSSGGSSSAGGKASGGNTGVGGLGSGGAMGSGGATGGGGSGSSGSTSAGGTTGDAAAGGTGAGGSVAKGGADGGAPDGRASGGSGSGGSGTGGSSGAGGGGGVSSASNLPPAGASGQAAPSATGTKVTVLDWAGFKSAVSFTFDDSNQSQLDNYAALQAENDKGNNVRYTFYLITGKSQSGSYGQALKDGHELANHTKSHSSTATTSDIQAAQDYIQSTYKVTSYDIAAPNGASSYTTVVPPMNEFLTNRSAGNSGTGVAATDDPASKQWSLPCIIPNTGAAASAMESSITQLTNGGRWTTFLVHGFNTPASDQSEGAYQPVSITEFTTAVSWAKTQGTMWLDTVENVSAYWIAEYHFNKLSPSTSGSDKVWTWKTSDFNNPYPAGKFLRVKTDGGTLKQGSTTLTWNDHGYYEVSLDAGTLTLSP